MLVVELKKTHARISQAYADSNVVHLRASVHHALGGVSYLRLPELSRSLRVFQQEIKEDVLDEEGLFRAYVELEQAIVNFIKAQEKLSVGVRG